jgi:hypothetical protein
LASEKWNFSLGVAVLINRPKSIGGLSMGQLLLVITTGFPREKAVGIDSKEHHLSASGHTHDLT